MSDQSDAMLALANACVWACMTGNKTITITLKSKRSRRPVVKHQASDIPVPDHARQFQHVEFLGQAKDGLAAKCRTVPIKHDRGRRPPPAPNAPTNQVLASARCNR